MEFPRVVRVQVEFQRRPFAWNGWWRGEWWFWWHGTWWVNQGWDWVWERRVWNGMDYVVMSPEEERAQQALEPPDRWLHYRWFRVDWDYQWERRVYNGTEFVPLPVDAGWRQAVEPAVQDEGGPEAIELEGWPEALEPAVLPQDADLLPQDEDLPPVPSSPSDG